MAKLVIGNNKTVGVPVITKEIEKLPALGLLRAKDANGKLVASTTESQIMDFTGVTDFDDFMLANAYRFNTAISGNLDMSSVTSVTGTNALKNAFFNCVNLTSVDLRNLKSASSSSGFQNAFDGCTGITSLNLSSLVAITGSNCFQYAFRGCSSLSSVDLSTLNGLQSGSACMYMFNACSSLTSVVFPTLSIVEQNSVCSSMFAGCINLATVYFYSLCPNSFGSRTNQFYNMLSGVTGCTVHFPSNIQATIGSWADVANGFGGTNTTVLFDLPATNTLTGADSKTYTRNPKYDTQTALAWKVGAWGSTNFTPAYYTSGTSDPTTGTTIYSDSSCTTAETTVSSIA